MSWYVTSFYQFYEIPVEELGKLRFDIKERMAELAMVGLIILAPEGINGTVSGVENDISSFKKWLNDLVPGEIRYKDSQTDAAPFKKISVIERPEIVSLKMQGVVPSEDVNTYLSPSEWHAMLEADGPKVVIDTRNRYETKVGTFRGAMDPDIKAFSEWPSYVESLDLEPETPVLIFCTGGIRCEKAGLILNSKGLKKVYQLRDGILGYLAEYPDGYFDGECFVFDERVAVDALLQPSARFALCVGCGDPTEARRRCRSCGVDYAVCETCHVETCSKACASALSRAK